MIVQVLRLGGREPEMDIYIIPIRTRTRVMGVTRHAGMRTTLNTLAIFERASEEYAKSRRRRVL